MSYCQVRGGSTRIVFLFSDKAYKIARFRVFRPLMRFFQHCINGQVTQRLARFDPVPRRAVCKYLFSGIIANREEYYISQKYHEAGLARVLGIYFFGLVVVQERGSPLPENFVPRQHRLWNMMFRNSGYDISKARHQFALFSGEPKLVDLARGDLDADMFL